MVFTSNPMRGIDGMIRGHYKANLKSPEDILEELEDVGFLCFVHLSRTSGSRATPTDPTRRGRTSRRGSRRCPTRPATRCSMGPSASGLTTTRSTWCDGVGRGKTTVIQALPISQREGACRRGCRATEQSKQVLRSALRNSRSSTRSFTPDDRWATSPQDLASVAVAHTAAPPDGVYGLPEDPGRQRLVGWGLHGI